MTRQFAVHRSLALLLAATVAASAVTGAAHAADLTVSIGDIKTAEGALMIKLVGTEEQLADTGNGLASMILAPDTEGVSFTLHNLQPGTYGIQLFHDENNNGELDANMIGIPKEPWAFSNNAAGRFGPPKWQDIRFEISAEDTSIAQDISLNH